MGRQKQNIGNRFKRINATRAWMPKRMIGQIPLDVRKCLSNNSCITLAPPLSFVGEAHLGQVDFNKLVAPLFRQVKSPRNDVHQGRVPFSNNARFELRRITAAPPLMPFGHNAVLGRLLLFTHSILGRAASWATKATLNCCDGQRIHNHESSESNVCRDWVLIRAIRMIRGSLVICTLETE